MASRESDRRELLARACAGDDAAFGELVRQYRGLVFSVCFEHTGSFGDSEDLTQEVLLTAHRSLSSLLLREAGEVGRRISSLTKR